MEPLGHESQLLQRLVQCIAFFRCPRPVLGRRALLQACRGELGKTQLFLYSLREGHGCIQACLCTLRFLAAVHLARFFVLDGEAFAASRAF